MSSLAGAFVATAAAVVEATRSASAATATGGVDANATDGLG